MYSSLPSLVQRLARRAQVSVFALFVVLAADACGDNTATGVSVSSVAVNATTSTLRAGNTLTLTATVQDASGKPVDNVAIAWSSSNTSVATVSN
ncbi:MAG: Ig-like domain-containing protein [Gemmatimonadaceae bacterium]